ncbi:hypothetical protein BDW75DRAFT_215699 [Aspergillus navahoensis]
MYYSNRLSQHNTQVDIPVVYASHLASTPHMQLMFFALNIYGLPLPGTVILTS